MKAVRDSRGVTALISRDEASVFNKVAMHDYLSITSLSEREHHLAEQLYQRNVLQKVKRQGSEGYKIYPQINAL